MVFYGFVPVMFCVVKTIIKKTSGDIANSTPCFLTFLDLCTKIEMSVKNRNFAQKSETLSRNFQ